MANCFNCENKAVWLVKNPGTSEQLFCEEHLPKFYKEEHFGSIVLKYQDLFRIADAVLEVDEKPELAEVQKPKVEKKPTKKVVVEETV